MARISFVLAKSEAVAIALQQEIEGDAEEVQVIFDDVKDELALWLLMSASAYHGLVPRVQAAHPGHVVVPFASDPIPIPVEVSTGTALPKPKRAAVAKEGNI